MDRRKFLGNLVIGGSVVWLLPSCMRNTGNHGTEPLVPLVNEEQLNLLGELVDTIIPETDTPGAKTLKVHYFVLTMVNDCRSEEYQENFLYGLDEWESYCVGKTGKPFFSCSYNERISTLKGVSQDENVSPGITALVSDTRDLTIRGYANSQYVMTGPVPYELVPGHFRGCVEVNKS